MKEQLEYYYKFLGSKSLALGLFIILAIIMVPGSLVKTGSLPYQEFLYNLLLGALGLNIAVCTVQRIKRLSKPALILHIGTLLVLLGCQISSLGYVATVNIYEGSSTDNAYRWDLNKDHPLAYQIKVDRIYREYYPIPLKVGVKLGEEKVGLHLVKTGDSFELEEFSITINSLDIQEQSVTYTIYDSEKEKLGQYKTSDKNRTLDIFPYKLELVAYQDPVIKKTWVDLSLLQQNVPIAQGSSAVNDPFIWEGLRFFNTEIGSNSDGLPYAGIQIVKDPGIPYVYFGFSIFSLGLLLALKKIF